MLVLICHVLACMIILTNQKVGEEIKIKDILDESKSVINSQITRENDEILKNYFFTKDKNSSIWNMAKNERDTITNKILEKVSAKYLQKVIGMIKIQYEKCIEMKQLKKRVKCWFNLGKTLTDINAYMKWNASLSTEVNYGIYYNAYALMIFHISIIAATDYKEEHGENLGKSIAEFTKANKTKLKESKSNNVFVTLITDLINLLDDIETSARKWRLTQVTPVIVCDVIEIFWQEIEENCKPAITKFLMIEKELNSSRYDAKTKNERIAHKLGTNLEVGNNKYRFKIKDKVMKKVIYERDIVIEMNKDDVKKALRLFIDHVMGQKVKSERKLKDQLNNYSKTYYESVGNLGDSVINIIT